MKKTKLLILGLSSLCSLFLLTGCNNSNIAFDNINANTAKNINVITTDLKHDKTTKNKKIVSNKGLNTFDSSLVDSINIKNENYMVSPLSFKYALSLATVGAKGETQQQLLKALGFDSVDSLLKWVSSVDNTVDNFNTNAEEDAKFLQNSENKTARTFNIANSVWHNSDKEGKFTNHYKSIIKDNFKAAVNEVPGKDLSKDINGWVNTNTNGLIPKLFEKDISNMNTILVNTLYLKSAWNNQFEKGDTYKDKFTTINKKVIDKDMMHLSDSFSYYKDKSSQVLIMPLEGNINVAFVLGDNSNISDKINHAENKEVNVTLPKFEVESSFENQEFLKYLSKNGVTLALKSDGSADFSDMIKGYNMHIDDIIQKTKLKVNESGLEAAAVTAVIMKTTAFIPEDTQKPEVFNANKPFSFYIYTNVDSKPETLFFGQYVK